MNTHRRLTGKTILNIRPLERALPLAKAIENEGGKCIILPSIDIVPVTVNQPIEPSDCWIFTSQYAVQYAPQFLFKTPNIKIAAIGKATANALEKAHVSVDFIPSEYSSEGLLSMPKFQKLNGKKITIFRGKNGRLLLDETLKKRGADVRERIVYERVAPVWTQEDYELLDQKIDIALGLSVESLTYFFSKLHLLERYSQYLSVPWLVMSHRVASEAKRLGMSKICLVSNGDIIESLIRYSSFG